jgi:hypothetical protein
MKKGAGRRRKMRKLTAAIQRKRMRLIKGRIGRSIRKKEEKKRRQRKSRKMKRKEENEKKTVEMLSVS